MAKKLKLHFNPRQPGLFDLADLDGTTTAATNLPVHPSIERAAEKAARQAATAAEVEADRRAHDSMEMDLAAVSAPDTMLFVSFGSGSSGNCSFIGTRAEGFLIDAGVDVTTVVKGLRDNGLSLDNIHGICLTHDHSDHVRYVYTLLRRNPRMQLYCTPKVLNGILRRHSISRRIKDYHHAIYKEFEFDLAGFRLTAFDVSHDGTDNMGYYITRGKHSFAIATDLGEITERVDHYMRLASYIVIESNYDRHMLDNGPYPMHLRARIAAARGHMDNVATGRFLAGIYTPQLTHVFLCHLSHDNNKPEIALATVRAELATAGITAVGDGTDSLATRHLPLQLMALPRFDASPLFVLKA